MPIETGGVRQAQLRMNPEHTRNWSQAVRGFPYTKKTKTSHKRPSTQVYELTSNSEKMYSACNRVQLVSLSKTRVLSSKRHFSPKRRQTFSQSGHGIILHFLGRG
jgi:hypothetical protein